MWIILLQLQHVHSSHIYHRQYTLNSHYVVLDTSARATGDANQYKKSSKLAHYLFNLMSRLIVHSSDDDSLRGPRGPRGHSRPRDPSLAEKLKHSVIIFISRTTYAEGRNIGLSVEVMNFFHSNLVMDMVVECLIFTTYLFYIFRFINSYIVAV